jgi:RNA polymerase sigma factor (sigma-70 family)
LPLGPAPGDDRLVARVRAGDQQAFERIVDRYERPLLSFCRHMLGRAHDAEEAVQQTFVSAYQSLVRHPERDINLRPWLFTIARNSSLSMLRSRRDHADIADVEPATSGLAEMAEQRDDLRHLLADLAELPDDQRAALLLFEIGALERNEIAAVIGCEPKKVKALVFQARSHLWNSRTARETACEEICEQLATLSGGALRRAPLRRHLRDCPGCNAFEAETKRQRAAMAIVLPVLPSAALKGAIMSAIAGGSTAAGVTATGAAGGAAATGVAVSSAATGAAGGGLATAGAVKAALAVLGIAAAGTGGVALERSLPASHPVTLRLAPVVTAAPAAVPPGASTVVSATSAATPGTGRSAAVAGRTHSSTAHGQRAAHGRSADAPGASVAAAHRSDRAAGASKGANGAAHRANPPQAGGATTHANRAPAAKPRRRTPPKTVPRGRPASSASPATRRETHARAVPVPPALENGRARGVTTTP